MEVHVYKGQKLKSLVFSEIFNDDNCVKVTYDNNTVSWATENTYFFTSGGYDESKLVQAVAYLMGAEKKSYAVIYTNLKSDSKSFLALQKGFEQEWPPRCVVILMCQE